MQLFNCTFCGPRDEREFYFVGEAGKVRPNTKNDVGAEEWRKYLYTQKNLLGETEEIWVHLPCRELFQMKRDSVTMEVISTDALRKEVR